MKTVAKFALLILAIPLVGLLFRYGTLAPCGMLKKDMRAEAVSALFENAPASDNPFEMMGQGLGILMLGPMIDNFLASQGPWDCSKALYKLHVQGEEVLPKDAAATAQKEQEKLRSEAVQAEREAEELAEAKEEEKRQAERQAYIQNVELYGFKAKYFSTYSDKRVPGVEFKLKNNGERVLRKVEVTVYFKDRSGAVIAEQEYNPVLVTKYSFSGDNKPLKPNYIWQLEKGKFLQAKSVPSEWAEGRAEARITDIEFLEGEAES